jgi:hypothetical protein
MRRYFLLIFYVAISLLIGKEFHPFARFTMFNAFPNYSYAFYLNNERGELVPFRTGVEEHKDAAAVAHQFYAFFSYHNYRCGFGEEDTTHLHEAGKELMSMILQDADTTKMNYKALRLYRRYYHLENDSIVYSDYLMYEKVIRP